MGIGYNAYLHPISMPRLAFAVSLRDRVPHRSRIRLSGSGFPLPPTGKSAFILRFQAKAVSKSLRGIKPEPVTKQSQLCFW